MTLLLLRALCSLYLLRMKKFLVVPRAASYLATAVSGDSPMARGWIGNDFTILCNAESMLLVPPGSVSPIRTRLSPGVTVVKAESC